MKRLFPLFLLALFIFQAQEAFMAQDVSGKEVSVSVGKDPFTGYEEKKNVCEGSAASGAGDMGAGGGLNTDPSNNPQVQLARANNAYLNRVKTAADNLADAQEQTTKQIANFLSDCVTGINLSFFSGLDIAGMLQSIIQQLLQTACNLVRDYSGEVVQQVNSKLAAAKFGIPSSQASSIFGSLPSSVGANDFLQVSGTSLGANNNKLVNITSGKTTAPGAINNKILDRMGKNSIGNPLYEHLIIRN